jgi:hypothetical protein
MVLTMAGFALAIVETSVFVERHHPRGTELYVLSALPAIPIFCMMAVLGMYLQREKDEFQRVVMVRSLLWAIAGTLGVNAFAGLLRGFGAIRPLPPFAEFAAFWVLFGAVQTVQVVANRVKSND